MTLTTQLTRSMKIHILLIGWILAVCESPAPAQTRVDLRTQAKSIDFSEATSTKPMQSGTALPSTCSVGQMFFLTTATAGLNVYSCTAANVWTPNGGAGLPNYAQSFTGQTSVVLAHNLGTTNVIAQCFDANNAHVEYATFSITSQNQATATFFSPQTGRCVVSGYGGATTNRYAASFVSQTSVVISAATHQLGTGDLSISCYDAATTKNRIEPDRVQIDAIHNVTITFFSGQSGRCLLQ